jgi:peptidoglycan/xylan/chitin deacetylase (PgdA/CDA1 family)
MKRELYIAFAISEITLLLAIAAAFYLIAIRPAHINTTHSAGQIVWEYPNTGKTLYLTIDDGPNPKSLPSILSLLTKHNIKATFFLVGSKVSETPELVKQIVESGNQVGNHTYNHVNGYEVNENTIEQELSETDAAIFKAAQIHPAYFRPPFGFFNYRFFQVAKKFNYQIILWTADAGDWNDLSETELMERLKAASTHGAIVLLHDRENTAKYLDAYLTWAHKNGFQFKLLP